MQISYTFHMVWDVFDQFPMIKEFIFQVGRWLRDYIPVSIQDVAELFREKVLGHKNPERTHDRVR